MTAQPHTTIDLAELALSHGEGRRLDLPVSVEPFELGGQTYRAAPASVAARVDLSRPAGGWAFRLRFSLRLEGPCMRCLESAAQELEIDSREVERQDTEDEELRSPYVDDDSLDVGRWAHDAAALALPAQILCRPECAGLCAACGKSLNDTDPAEHEHASERDPRWAKLDELKRR